MIESFEEFASELEMLREEIKSKKDELDVALVAAWVDKLVILLDSLAKRLALLQERVDVLSQKP